MTATSTTNLGQGELLELALAASRNGDSATAIAHLENATARADATGVAHFLLGSEYAQQRMYDRAAIELKAAIQRDPALAIARFQLGLLLLSSGDAQQAMDVLLPLTQLGAQHPLAQFGQGLLHLMRDEFAPALECLKRGIELNTENAALNADMQKIIGEIERLIDAALAPSTEDHETDGSDTNHIFLSAYTGQGTTSH